MEKSQFDAKNFSTEGKVERLEKPWGYELHWARTPEYAGKLIHIDKGKRISLQYHDQKMESHFLLKGKVTYWMDDASGEYVPIDMEIGKGYAIVPFQRHRFEAHEDSDIVEVSTPEKGTTFRPEDDFNRGNETEEVRKEPGRGWKG